MQLHRKILAGALSAAALLAVTGTAGAKPASTEPYIRLEQPAGLRTAGEWEPGLGELITFDSSAPTNVKNPRIEAMCYQDGTKVWGAAGAADQAVQEQLTGYPGFVLGGSSSLWLQNGGDVSCKANLFYLGSGKGGVQTYNVLATTTFTAHG